MSIATQVEAMVAETVTRFGRLDFAVNNAGIDLETTPLSECPDEIFDRVIAVNVKGMFLCVKHEIRQMQRQSGGAGWNRTDCAHASGANERTGQEPITKGVVRAAIIKCLDPNLASCRSLSQIREQDSDPLRGRSRAAWV